MSDLNQEPRPDSFDAALRAFAAGRLDEARDACRASLALDAGRSDTLDLLGTTYLAEQRFAEAEPWFTRSVALRPDGGFALGNLGATLLALGRPAEAAEVLQRGLERIPDHAPMHCNLGRALELLGDDERAMASQARAIVVDPALVPAQIALGCLFEKAGQLAEALDCFDAALRVKPTEDTAHYNRGVVLQQMGRLEEAGEEFAAALRYGRPTAARHNNLGLTLYRRGRLEEAVAEFRRAVELDGVFAGGVVNLANALYDQGDIAAATAAYARALELDPGNNSAQLNLALGHLTLGDFERGWPLFAAELLSAQHRARMPVPANLPLWDFQTRDRRRVVLVTEPGFGDAIQFARYGRALAELGVAPVLQCHPRLCRLLATAPGFSAVVPDGTRFEPGEYSWFPLMGLPAALGEDPGSLPSAPIPYLTADPERIERWDARLGASPYRVGIAWQGNPVHEHEYLRGRSLPLTAFGELIDLPEIGWISLQKGPGTEQLDALPWRERLLEFGEELDAGPDAFVDTAAIMMNLDLVITSDTAVAHLAGALGIPVWVALSSRADWRWMLGRSDSPWYPNMRLYRQERPGDWSGVMRRVRAQLSAALTQQS